MDAHGEVVSPLRLDRLRAALEACFEHGLRSVAVALMHAFGNPDHELLIGQAAAEIGFTQVSLSHDVSPLMKLVSRADTTVVDAYLSPVLRRYVDRVSDALPGVRCQFMRSSGGLSEAHHFRGKDAILSGPAGGIVGMARTAEAAGFDRVIGFDMGGTSTDVSHYDGVFERTFDSEVAGVRVRAPMMSVHTVAAGGGSILQYDGQRYRVGPASAGADPGPAAYGAGGPLTVTDANVVLGRIQPEHFPAVFGASGTEPLDADRARRGFDRLTRTIGDGRTAEEVAAGFLRIAVTKMAEAIKRISVQRGHDVSRYTLSTFGGAGGQHACAVAEALGMERILVHPFAGVLSAYGMGLAEVTATREASVEAPLEERGASVLDTALAPLVREATGELVAQGVAPGQLRVERRAHLKYSGTDTSVEVRHGPPAVMRSEFERLYRRRFSFLMPEREVVVEAVSVEVTAAASSRPDELETRRRATPLVVATTVPMYTGSWIQVPLHRRVDLALGDVVEGPAIIAEANATTVVDPGWRAEVTDHDNLVLRRAGSRPAASDATSTVDPVMLELFNNLFMSVAEQMGERLRATASSVNIKERLDFSCALFDPEGNLIANAPHMPVHLGSMGESIRTVIEAYGGTMGPGDSYVLNNPYRGGTHLPDITVVTPVFGTERQPLFYVASRGHHADVGGVTPGSMPSFSTRVEEEGVLVDNAPITRDGRMLTSELGDLLTSGPYPARNPRDNVADLRAQLAANEKGVTELHALARDFGLEVVLAYMGHVRANAAEAVRRVIAALHDGHYRYELDTGAVIEVDDHRRPGESVGAHRLHRYVGPAAGQLQRTVVGHQGGGALRLPLTGRRRHPAQRGLPRAAGDRDPRGKPPGSSIPGGGRRGQRRDVPGSHRRALRGARCPGRGLGDDEQPDVRERALPVLRDRGQRLRCGSGLRRHRRGADAHDELAAHRPRGPRVALPGARRELRGPPWQRWPGTAPRWGRGPSTPAVPRAHDRDPAQQPSPRPAVRHARRRAGGARPAVDRGCRRQGPAPPRPRLRGGRSRGRAGGRDTGRRRIRYPPVRTSPLRHASSARPWHGLLRHGREAGGWRQPSGRCGEGVDRTLAACRSPITPKLPRRHTTSSSPTSLRRWSPRVWSLCEAAGGCWTASA